MHPEQGIAAGQIRALFGLARKTLEYLTVQKEYVTASVATPQGPGSSRLYSLAEVYRVGFLEQLRRHGVEYPRAATLMACVPGFLNFFHEKATQPLPRLLTDYQRLQSEHTHLQQELVDLRAGTADQDLPRPLWRWAYNPFEFHSIPPLDYILDILDKGGDQKGLILHLGDDRHRYGPFLPYAILEKNPADPQGWEMTIIREEDITGENEEEEGPEEKEKKKKAEDVETFFQTCTTYVSINLTALSRDIQTCVMA